MMSVSSQPKCAIVAVEMKDGEYPGVYYFPRKDVTATLLRSSGFRTFCPFKGTAHYFSLAAGGVKLDDAAWSYEDPFRSTGV